MLALARRLRFVALLAMAVLPGALRAQSAAPPLAAGQTRAIGPLQAGESVAMPLAVAAGDYVRGAIEVAAGRFDLDLQTAEGRHLRRLAGDAEGKVTYRFVVSEAPVRLVAIARAAGAAQIALDARIEPSRQAEPIPVPGPFLSPAMEKLAGAVAQGQGTDTFWAELMGAGTPLVEPGPKGQAIVTFLARGARRNVRLFGAPSGDHEWLERLGESDVWFRSFLVPGDTRLSYQIAPDVPDPPGTPRERRLAILATAQADPYNLAPWPQDAPDAFNRDSTLALAGAPPQPGLEEAGAPRGTLSQFTLPSARLGNSRTVTLYTPPGFTPSDPRNALLIVFDARAYLTKVPTPQILDNLIAQGRLPPVAAVFVSEIDAETRARELPGNPAFADFLAQELLPEVQKRTGARVPAARTILAGSSYGGLAAATVALAHPDRFGNVIALSGSFWWHPPNAPADAGEHVAGKIVRGPRRAVRFHLSAGLFETAHGGTAGILETSRHLRDVLAAKGYDVSYREYAGGHDYFVWRGALADALLALAPRL